MKVTLLKPLRYAYNGVKVVDHKKGDDVEIHARHHQGLIDGGYVAGDAKPAKPPEPPAAAGAQAGAEPEADAGKGDGKAPAKDAKPAPGK